MRLYGIMNEGCFTHPRELERTKVKGSTGPTSSSTRRQGLRVALGFISVREEESPPAGVFPAPYPWVLSFPLLASLDSFSLLVLFYFISASESLGVDSGCAPPAQGCREKWPPSTEIIMSLHVLCSVWDTRPPGLMSLQMTVSTYSVAEVPAASKDEGLDPGAPDCQEKRGAHVRGKPPSAEKG